jgi:hypothetical protein
MLDTGMMESVFLFGILNFGHCDLFVICILVLGILFDSAISAG